MSDERALRLQALPWIYALALGLAAGLWVIFGITFDEDAIGTKATTSSQLIVYLVMSFAIALSLMLLVASFIVIRRRTLRWSNMAVHDTLGAWM